MSEKLCLQWNDYQDNIKSSFGNLRGDNDFADVTLACDDGQQVEAHKVILASSSPFFQKLLARNKHQHPVIYMRRVKYDDLLATMDFLYRGETNVFQDDLDSFLALAEDLQLKGLMGKGDEKFEVDEKPSTSISPPKTANTLKTLKRDPGLGREIKHPIADTNRTVAIIPGADYPMDIVELDEKVKSMMEKSQNKIANGQNGKWTSAHKCKVCGKEGLGKTIKDHIEANHLDGVAIPCNLCDKTFRSRNALRQHSKQNHSQISVQVQERFETP